MNKNPGKVKIISLLLGVILFAIGGFFLYGNRGPSTESTSVPSHEEDAMENTTDFKNFILLGWDGTQREHLYDLLNAGNLPNLEELIAEGAIVNTIATTGETTTKPGWTEILTGYTPEITGVYSTLDYGPIPKGYTIFERLERYFGKDNIATLFVGGKNNNITARGPHKVCVNCVRRYQDTFEETDYWQENTSAPTVVPGEERVFEQREGDPYYYTKDALDVYEIALGDAANVGLKTIDYMEEYKNQRFFAFFHFEEPDEIGHKYGGGSKEYRDGIITNDYWLGEIVSKLKESGIYEETLIYITSDHGFGEEKKSHRNSPYVFLAANDKDIKKDGDRKDITPTILNRYGIDIKAIMPPLDGISLIK